jgi:hypothetical protein
MWRVPKEKGEIILCRECPELRRKEKDKEKVNKILEFRKALSTKRFIQPEPKKFRPLNLRAKGFTRR